MMTDPLADFEIIIEDEQFAKYETGDSKDVYVPNLFPKPCR